MNADDIYRALQQRHKTPEWVLVRELRLGTGFGGIDWEKWEASGRKSFPKNTIQQRIDAWALNCYPGNGFRRIAYEIKVSRGHFIKEKRDPEKRQAAMEVSDYFYFAAPRGLIAPMELPQGCGLLVVYDSGRSEILERAPKLNPTRLDWCFVASVLRSVMATRREDLTRDRFQTMPWEEEGEDGGASLAEAEYPAGVDKGAPGRVRGHRDLAAADRGGDAPAEGLGIRGQDGQRAEGCVPL